MLHLDRLEVTGFGPFADTQTIEFPREAGVTVVYGDNMRGKTSLLNAIRYAFFGTVLGRSSRVRKLHTISNRELAKEGQFGFSVSLAFTFNDEPYELVRQCSPKATVPTSDADYEETAMLRRGADPMGPQERERALVQIFPKEVSRFFLFDGELLQEYEELLINESEAGHKISGAIERILGVPLLKRGRAHLSQLSDAADRMAAKEATKQNKTQALGATLAQSTELKAEHQKEKLRLEQELEGLVSQRGDVEEFLRTRQKYSSILEECDEAKMRLSGAESGLVECQDQLKQAMAEAWRTVIRSTVREARVAAQDEAQRDMQNLIMSLRARAVDSEHCETCDQDLPSPVIERLRSTLPKEVSKDYSGVVTPAMSRLADLSKFRDADNTGEVQHLSTRIATLMIEGVSLRDKIGDLEAQLGESDPEALRHGKASLSDVIEKSGLVRRGIEEEKEKIEQYDQNVQRLTREIEAVGASALRACHRRARILRDASNVFRAAVEEYKNALRTRVEESASTFFRQMTTEKQDYAGLRINESYGLSIVHRDGRLEEARSAGAEHVVALALMGALQNNAPLRGPIVMDSPFGRLDESHTSNVVSALPTMATQVILLVYESEVGRTQVRSLLDGKLLKEYELKRVSGRRTNLQEVS